MTKLTNGGYAWFGLVTYVVMYDLWAAKTRNETLSMAFYNALDHPIKRWPIVAMWIYITVHLFKWLPDRLDPLRRIWSIWTPESNTLIKCTSPGRTVL